MDFARTKIAEHGFICLVNILEYFCFDQPVVQFMTDVYKHINFNSGTVIADNIAAIDHQTRNTLLKNEKNMLKIMEANQIDKIRETVSKEEDHYVAPCVLACAMRSLAIVITIVQSFSLFYSSLFFFLFFFLFFSPSFVFDPLRETPEAENLFSLIFWHN